MLSAFPHLLDFSFLAPTLLRIGLSAVFLERGLELYAHRRDRGHLVFESVGLRPGGAYAVAAAAFELAIGVLLLIGLFTQPASLLAAFAAFIGIIARLARPELVRSAPVHYGLIFAAAISLALLGPGMFAFDLPL